jgi:hypothetical protein
MAWCNHKGRFVWLRSGWADAWLTEGTADFIAPLFRSDEFGFVKSLYASNSRETVDK